MAEEGFKRKLTAILSADVAGYSRLMAEDEAATVKTLETYREVMSTLIVQHRGRVIDSPGDNLLAEFTSVVDAVQCAVAVQKEFQARNVELPENRRMEFRIGINLGDVIEEEERIYGDGVNIAARLEALADPGGICVSKTAFDQIETKLPLGYEYLGEQPVKNIPKPVGAYRVLMEPRITVAEEIEKGKAVPLWRRKSILTGGVALIVLVIAGLIWNFYFRSPPMEVASQERMTFPLPDKPSIAVLPFVNMSEDPKQEYLADGITENIISALSKVPKLFVIARQTTFAYKGKPVKIQQVAEELGVHYVLEGSVQRSGDNLRITAQLIDALGGHHMWSERYDRELKHIFALQDEITLKIIAALEVKLTAGERARLRAKGTENLQAYLKYVQALEPFYTVTKEGNAQARLLLEEVIALDPEFPAAYALLGSTHFMDVPLGSSKSPRESINQAFELMNKAITLDDSYASAHSILGWLYILKERNYDKAIAECERALDLAPNLDISNIWMGLVLTYAGRHEEAVRYCEQALRLNPIPPAWNFRALGWAYFGAGRYEEAIAAHKKGLQRTPNDILTNEALTVAYSWAGRLEEARAQAAEILRINPKYSVEQRAKRSLYKNQADRDRYLDGLRKAGLPEKPPLPLPDKPSIAVLPFVNISGDPQQEYLSDGITESIITALSKTPKLFVIARNSTFTYKGKPVKVQQVRHELGVRYVLEGSVQRYVDYGVDPDRSGPMPMQKVDSLRITAQLVDAKTGYQIWAERYDRELRDFFALQDEITMKIITAMQVKLTEGERARVHAKGTDNLQAYLKFLRGEEHFLRYNADGFMLARPFFEEAIVLDPEYPDPYIRMGSIHLNEARLGVSKDPQKSLGQAFKLAQKALTLDETHPYTHNLLSWLYLRKRQFEKAIAESERAVVLSPNHPGGLSSLGLALSVAGRPQEAIPYLEKAIRFDPSRPWPAIFFLGDTYRVMEQYERAIPLLKKALRYQPNAYMTLLVLAACYSALGREKEARATVTKLLKVNPNFSLERYETQMLHRGPVKERLLANLHKAGLK
jgi:adenylate cyclase